MKPWTRWMYVITGLSVAVVAVSSAAAAIRQGSWSPIIEVSWLPAVVAAAWPGTRRRCLPRRRRPAG